MEIKEFIQRREMALLIIQAMGDDTKLKRGLVNPLMERHEYGGRGNEIRRVY